MKKLYLFALVAMLFAACATDDTQDLRPVDAPETLTVGFEGGDDDTRVQLNSAGKTVWTKDDLVSVFYRSDANQKWQFQGETGERLGNLKRVNAGSATETMQRVVVVYPYNENYYINTETYNIETTLPSTQTYVTNSYGLDGNLMISSDEFNQISLKSVYGWLKLQLTGNGERVQSITLKGNNGEQVAGLVYINSSNAAMTLAADMGSADDPAVGGVGGNLIFDDAILTEITLNCGNGVALGAEATAFYIALPPQMFEKGITVEIADTSGYTMTQSTDKSLAIKRNTIQPMTEFEYSPNIPHNNEIYYTNGSTTEATAPNKTDVFGANIVSNLYDAEKKCWVITFDGDVTSIGEFAFFNCDSLTSVTIPDSVTSIGKYAFFHCDSLTSVTIPDSVTSIGSSAFNQCTSLKSVTIPDSVTEIGELAFYNCTSLTSVTIGNGVTSIGYEAFQNCTSLTSVTIPDSVTSIGEYAFRYCTSLTSVTIGNGVTSIGSGAFDGCSSLRRVDITDLSAWCKISFVGTYANPLCNGAKLYINNTEATDIIIPSDITEIKEYTFSFYSSLTGITIHDSVTSIGGQAFTACNSLTSVNIPGSVTKIGEEAFGYCKSLTNVTIGNGVTEIGSGTFRDCTSLTSINIPDSVTGIGVHAFSGCTSLTRVDITDLSAWCKISFDSTYANPLCNGAKLYINNTEATNITIPSDITEIKEYAFSFYSSLTGITIHDSVTSIGERAFYKCALLTSVTIGKGVNEIGTWAFDYCTSLKEVYCKPTTPPTGDSGMFSSNASGRKIYVPASDDDSIINSYKAQKYWSYYASSIFEYDFSAEQ